MRDYRDRGSAVTFCERGKNQCLATGERLPETDMPTVRIKLSMFPNAYDLVEPPRLNCHSGTSRAAHACYQSLLLKENLLFVMKSSQHDSEVTISMFELSRTMSNPF